MIESDDIEYWVWLSEAIYPGIPDAQNMLSIFDYSPKKLYEFGQPYRFQNIKNISNKTQQRLSQITLKDAQNIIYQCQKNNYQIITYTDKKYPIRLKNIYSSPTLLYIKGNLNYIDNTLAIAIIGARKCSDYAKDVTKYFAEKLAKNNITIISGLAIGVDSIALETSVKNGNSTIAVIGCGIDINYPKQNKYLKDAIASLENGCIISEYPPNTKPLAINFPIRNRIISGLSVGVLVVEASAKSGALITAQLAIDQGKDIFGIPNNIFDKNNSGVMNLLKSGAIIATSPQDILDQYEWQYDLKNKSNINTIFPIFPSMLDHKLLINNNINDCNNQIENKLSNDIIDELDKPLKDIFGLLLDGNPQSIDYISTKLDVPVNEIIVNITKLELDGYIKSYPGGKYAAFTRCNEK